MRRGAKLGQHFLRSEKALARIIATADLQKKDVVLEIGPGKGALTRLLLENAKQVIAVEKDSSLIEPLNTQFKKETANKKLILINDDIRHCDTSQWLEKKPYKLVANIPYYITGELLRTFLSGRTQPERIVFLVQKEVALRIAREKKESILSLSVKAYGEPTYIGTVAKSAFSPPPKVDSAILLIDNISRKNFKKTDEKHFFEVLKAGFAQKRKLLRRNLESKSTPSAISRAFDVLKLDPNVRAEDIHLSDWLTLSTLLLDTSVSKRKQST